MGHGDLKEMIGGGAAKPAGVIERHWAWLRHGAGTQAVLPAPSELHDTGAAVDAARFAIASSGMHGSSFQNTKGRTVDRIQTASGSGPQPSGHNGTPW